MPTNKVIEEQYEDLHSKLTSKVYGVTEELKELLNIDDDININLGNSLNQGTSGHANLADLVVRSGKKKEDLSQAFTKMMEDMGQSYIHSIPFNDRIRLIREFNFMLTQMPQLFTTLSSMAHHIMSPDNYNNEPLEMDIYVGENSDITEGDIRSTLTEKNLYKLIKDSIRDSLCLGYRYLEVVPLAEVADKLVSRISKLQQKKKEMSGNNPMNMYSTSFLHNLNTKPSPKRDTEDLVLYGESGNVVIPKDFVNMYRETYTSGDIGRNELSSMLYDAVNEVIGIGDYNKQVKMYSESYKKEPSSQGFQELLASHFFSESPYSIESRDAIAYKVHCKLMGCNEEEEGASSFYRTVYAEDDESFKKALISLKKNKGKNRRTKIKDLTGCHVNILDDEKTYPIIVNKEEIGVYVIDTYQDIAFAKTFSVNINNVLGSSKFSDQADYKDNPLVRRDIINGLASLISKHLDANFVTDNRRTLAAIKELLDEKDLYNMQFRIRWIPRKHLVPFHAQDNNNGLGKSRLLYARIPIIFWIYLNQSKLLTKLFYEKDKLVIKYRTTFAQSLYNDRQDAMEIFTNLFPLPSELLDFTRVNACLGTIGRILIPVDKQGNELFQVDRIEGQKYDTSNDDYMGELEKTIELLLGFPMKSIYNAEDKYEYATSIIAQDGRLTQLITDMQVHYTPMATELATKIARYETGSDDVFVEIHFPSPKLLVKSISDESLAKFSENIDNNIKLYYGEDKNGLTPEKELFIKRELIKELYPSYDNTDLMTKIEEKWKAHKADFIQSLNTEEGTQE